MANDSSTTSEPLLTAEEFGRRPDPGYPEELVEGRIVATALPKARHGFCCAEVVFYIRLYLAEHDLGRVISNDAGVLTHRGPDSLRGPDVAYYSYAKLPKGPLPEGYPDVPPDLIIEVLSPSDQWRKVLEKVAEYLNVGVSVVGVLDPERSALFLFDGDEPVRILGPADELTLPALLGDFRVVVGRFFA